MSGFKHVADLPGTLRSQYFASLREPQEWFLEELVRSGDVRACDGAGYAVFHGNTLVEFYATHQDEAQLLLSQLLRHRPFTKALSKSFDHVLINAARTLGWPMVETGFLFRNRTAVVPQIPDDFQLERAKPTDLAEIWEIGQDFFTSIEEVERLFRDGGLWSAFHNGQLVGSGVMIPIDGSGDVMDIGMVTRQIQRNKGFASMIVSELADIVEGEGKRPICGCAEHNHASKAALENAGFISNHRLVQISISE